MKTKNVITSVGLFLALGGVAGAQTVTNGGFETYTNGSPTNFSGWTEFITGGKSCTGGNSGPKKDDGYLSETAAALSGNSPCQSGLYQNISGLTTGSKYEVSFFAQVSKTKGLDNNLSVFFNGTEIFGQQIDNSVWEAFTATFIADEAMGELRFAGYNDPASTLIDNVKLTETVTATPEPGTFALLGTGLVGLLPMVRRKKKQ